MREARLENRSILLRLSAAPGVKADPRGRSGPGPRLVGGVRLNAQHTRPSTHENRIAALLPLLENVLQTAGYLVLTTGAVALLFHFAP